MLESLDKMYSNSKDRCTLMCKNKPLISFTLYGDSLTTDEIKVINEYFIKVENLSSIISDRISIVNRFGLKDLLSSIGLSSKIEILKFTQGISLSDCLWLKFESSNSVWEDINPYVKNHSFDLECLLESSTKLKTVFPNYSINGNYPKCWKTSEEGIHQLIKCGTPYPWNSGLEPLGDILTEQVCDMIGFKDYIKYNEIFIDYDFKESWLLKETLKEHKGRLGSICNNFTNENLSLISAKDLGLRTYKECIDFSRQNNLDTLKIGYTLLFDCITFNEDRHMGNLGFLYNPDSMNFIDVAPMYDNNLAFLPYWDDRVDLLEYAKEAKARDGSSFIELYKFVLQEFPELIFKIPSFNLKCHIIKSDRIGRLNYILNWNLDRLNNIIVR